CGRLTCDTPKVNGAGTYAFVDVTIPAGVPSGSDPLNLRTQGGAGAAPFSVSPALPAAGRFQGFGPNDVVYLIMPDRFANGDTTNDNPSQSPGLIDRSKGRYYHGGDLAGVRQRLPYLKSLGVTAIWLNPIYDNNDRLNERETYDGQAITDYHGYGAVAFYAAHWHFRAVAAFSE